ncbi:hypothetical protein PHISP_02244 [Aspergillus sp. HF37]|nr:hypothetical protein PHISP_02244 [Aspergillus sp. HF37]
MLSLLPLLFLPLLASALSADLLAWPLSSPQPSPLARVSYDPASRQLSLDSYHPPGDDGSLIRLGLAASSSSSSDANSIPWAASLTSPASLTASKDRRPLLRLHLGPAGEVFHVSVSISDNANGTDSPAVELVENEPGPRPQLNRPVVLGPDGKTPDEVVEKTFLQKYWWVFLLITFVAMSGSGDG